VPITGPARILAVVALLTVLAGCTSAGPQPGGRSGSTGTARHAASNRLLYVSVGDSYAAGSQPVSQHTRFTTRNGFAYQLVSAARQKGYEFRLANFGCGGATTASVLHSTGCRSHMLGQGAPAYSHQTQAAAAQDFLSAYRGRVGLVTVAIGLNDVSPCFDSELPIQCVAHTLPRVSANLATLLQRLRHAAGPAARIVGISYPDVFLGAALTRSGRGLARRSVRAFETLINPALRRAYEAVGGTFVDVTKATGGYGSWTDTVTLPPYGEIAAPVAKVCELTFYCQYRDVHPRTIGYALIARRILAVLPTR
jgi:lysophospholipase L1-like esterase